MENRDWERFGEEIRRNVQDAIDSHDYSMLNRTISDTVNGAVDYFSHTMRNMGSKMNQNMQAQQEEMRRRQQEEMYRRQQEQGASYQGQQTQGNAAQGQTGTAYNGGGYRYQGAGNRASYYGNANAGMTGAAGRASGTVTMPALYAPTTATRAGGLALCVAGYGMALFPALMVVLIPVIEITTGEFGNEFWLVWIIFAILTAAFGSLAAVGTRMMGRARRFRAYIRTLAGREYCDIKELQEAIKKQKKFVVQDLEKMIQKGWFREGHLDSKGSCLMVSHKAYSQYTELMNRVEAEDREKKRKAKEQEKQRKAQEAAAQGNPNLSPEVREVIAAGEEYIRKIRLCNDAIPGEEISAKISRIELLVDKIFDRVEQNPDTISDLRRMLEYYLPTTVKLLEAYEDLDKQPVQGENILSSKREIEKTLDTLNVAFEKLLDSLFQDTAWDVSSDISVLHTMLAQEGLTGNDFTKNDK